MHLSTWGGAVGKFSVLNFMLPQISRLKAARQDRKEDFLSCLKRFC